MSGKTILIVEDENTIAEMMIQILLTETLHRAIWVADGLKIWTHLQTRTIDLLILDYNLPAMTGIDLYDRIHMRKEFEHIPAFLMSALDGRWIDEAKERSLHCLKKPFAIDDFLQMIERHFL